MKRVLGQIVMAPFWVILFLMCLPFAALAAIDGLLKRLNHR